MSEVPLVTKGINLKGVEEDIITAEVAAAMGNPGILMLANEALEIEREIIELEQKRIGARARR